MKRPFFSFLILAGLTLVGIIIYSLELSMPDRFEAIEMASARAIEFYENECGHSDDISVTTKVIFRGEDLFHVESEMVASEMASPSDESSFVHSFVYPTINLGVGKIENIDVIGVAIRCWN
ncbi:hypothetical protein [Allosediminivita pacifica]|uniref:hypothetical protein n=1 Tax=Allosediminivita pacifica TaxID=1267769 RepID=UPI0011B21566|nr:hypothetical protein [Allosediminivita pacifica]GGA96654.1 hypothetical protein GCM10011324_03670 [Allosediminivita pacifica]